MIPIVIGSTKLNGCPEVEIILIELSGDDACVGSYNTWLIGAPGESHAPISQSNVIW